MTLVLAGVRKFRTRTASLVGLLIAISLVALEFVAVGATYKSSAIPADQKVTYDWLLIFPSAYDAIIALLIGFGGLIALIYVAAVSGTEWSWGTLRVAVARGESRSRYVFATFASIAIVLLIGLLATFAAGVLAAAAGALLAGLPLSGLTDGPALAQTALKLARCWVAIVTLSSVGYATAMVARSQMAGIGAVIGLYIGSVFAPLFPLPDVIREIFKYLPFSAAGDAVGIVGPTTGGATTNPVLDPNVALLVSLAWLVGSLAIAALATERAEITS
jgi:ABC-type transport system involved in multi-copper enzyme maturation permease subunit